MKRIVLTTTALLLASAGSAYAAAPAIVAKLADCCAKGGIDVDVLKRMGVGASA